MNANLSPSPNRVGRACVCVLHQGRILMVSYADFFTFPGGGVNPDETFLQAAQREAWEEAGARVQIRQCLFEYHTDSGHLCQCFLADLETLEPSPEGRQVIWVDPLDPRWRKDHQIAKALHALRA
jgi:8-oxo-dGTP pyrophosphatase MutT (NUDIX family)